MAFTLKMFDPTANIIAVESDGYGSVVAHSHEFVELVFVRRGKGKHFVGDAVFPVQENNVFVLSDRNIFHSIQPLDGKDVLQLVNVIFPFDYFPINMQLFKPETVYDLSKVVGGVEMIERIFYEYTKKEWLYEDVMAGYTRILLSELLRLSPVKRKKTDATVLRQKFVVNYIDQAIAFIHKNYDKQVEVDQIASYCGICKAYLQRLFRKERNTSVKEYLIKYRIEQSCKFLLNTDYSVSFISEMVGFNDLKYFYLKFKEIVGETPVRFKQTFGSENKRSDRGEAK